MRATDGGRPAQWSEATVIVEIVDVDENMYAPVFADPAVLTARVPEDAPRGTVVLAATATDADPPGRDSRLAYYIVGGSGMAHFSIDDTGTVSYTKYSQRPVRAAIRKGLRLCNFCSRCYSYSDPVRSRSCTTLLAHCSGRGPRTCAEIHNSTGIQLFIFSSRHKHFLQQHELLDGCLMCRSHTRRIVNLILLRRPI